MSEFEVRRHFGFPRGRERDGLAPRSLHLARCLLHEALGDAESDCGQPQNAVRRVTKAPRLLSRVQRPISRLTLTLC